MKAMILAAGLGTRLLPLTEKTPKPLFEIRGRPLIDILIRRLQDSGCEAVITNTHHLATTIGDFIKGQDYDVPVHTRYEPTILGTGGGIKNVADFWDNSPLLVVNGDIFTNIDFAHVYRFHLNHKNPVTLVLHDCPPYNHVWVNTKDNIAGFGHTKPCPPKRSEPAPSGLTVTLKKDPGKGQSIALDYRKLAFTGIQVLDPMVLDFIPSGTFYNIIDAYCEMIRAGMTLKGFIARNHYWHDIGAVPGYSSAAREALAREALEKTFSVREEETLVWSTLKADGSDRTWYRAFSGKSSVLMVDHGPPPDDSVCEADAFFAIGRHLHSRGVSVPRIYDYDRSLGLLSVEDLGELHLQTVVNRTPDPADVFSHYKAVIDLLVTMAIEGANGFDPAFTYQSLHYDQGLILETEARYFVKAFLNGYMNLGITFDMLREEFEVLAENSLNNNYMGFLHRDFQSRNILIRNHKYYVIDFQGGRLGPLQYDLASLLIDPYVRLPRVLQEDLLGYYLTKLSDFIHTDRPDFLHAYRHCKINRNLQILGAFAFLSQVKGKKDFAAYIPAAVASLKRALVNVESICPKLGHVVRSI